MKIETQKILKYIPIVHIAIIIETFRVRFKYDSDSMPFFKLILKLLGCGIVFGIIHFILSKVIAWNSSLYFFSIIDFYVIPYLLFFTFSLLGIQYQEKLMRKDN